MDWVRKSRNSKISWIGALLLILLWPQVLRAHGHQYMKYYRQQADLAAAKLYFSEDRNVPRPFEEIGPIKTNSDSRLNCTTRLRRLAWRKKAEGIIGVKYTGEILSNHLTCEGTMIRWKEGETQSSETQESMPNQ